mgnify:CR=1 FL=1|jgi:hypothetical protein
MSNTEAAPFNRFSVPVKWGILVGVISIILTTVNFLFIIEYYPVFLVVSSLIYIISIVLYGVAGAQQRKAMGGYIDLKEAFQAIFIVILISSIISTIYGIVYVKLIDPSVMDVIKSNTLAFMERMNVPEEKLDQTAADFDREVAQGFKPGRLLYSFARQLVVQSIFGFICALIVRKKRPVFSA